MRHPARLGKSQIIKQRTRRRYLRAPRVAERIQGAQTIGLHQPGLGVRRIEPAGRQRRQRVAQLVPQRGMFRPVKEAVGQQQLARRDPGERRRQDVRTSRGGLVFFFFHSVFLTHLMVPVLSIMVKYFHSMSTGSSSIGLVSSILMSFDSSVKFNLVTSISG